MGYPRRLLNQGEEIALDLRPHWWFFSRNVLSGVPLLVVGVVFWRVDVPGPVWWLWGLAAIAWAVWLFLQYLAWQFTYFVVTDRRVIYRTGYVRRHGVEIPLTRVNNINFSQGVWERLIGAGDLEIESAGTDGRTRFTNVQHPDGVQQEIYRQMEVAEARASHGGVPTGGGDVAEQIARLADLRDRGAITQAEYDAKKTELLGRM